jgi:hypothetical protein
MTGGVGMQTEFTEGEFKKVAEAGGFVKIVVLGGWTHFSILGEMRGGNKGSLVSTRRRKAVRQFLNPGAALALLKRMGVMKAEVQMAEWDVEMASLSMRMRPDVTARRLRDRRIAEAAYYPDRPKETGELSRTDQLMKLWENKSKQAIGKA